jgi:hypothetical protein
MAAGVRAGTPAALGAGMASACSRGGSMAAHGQQQWRSSVGYRTLVSELSGYRGVAELNPHAFSVLELVFVVQQPS